jgi:hypothetical protein
MRAAYGRFGWILVHRWVLAVVLTAGVPLAARAAMVDVNFTYTDSSAGNLVATGTLTVDTTTGQALSGSGTLTSDLFLNDGTLTPMGPRSFFLVTPANCAATSSNCGLDSSLGGTFHWRDSDGTDIGADTIFNLASPNVSTDGLLFAVGNRGDHGNGPPPRPNGNYDDFGIYSTGAGLRDWLVAGGATGGPPGGTQLRAGTTNGVGTLTVTVVPLPAAAWLLLSGLGGLGAAMRRKQKQPPSP